MLRIVHSSFPPIDGCSTTVRKKIEVELSIDDDVVASVVSGFRFDPVVDFEAAKLFCLDVGKTVGEPFAYKQQNGGKLVATLSAHEEFRNRQSGHTRSFLRFHTDDAILARQCRPEWIVLLGLVSDSNSATLICSVDSIVVDLESRELEILQEPRFEHLSSQNYNFRNTVVSPPAAILARRDDHWTAQLSHFTRAADRADVEAQKAIDAFIRIANTKAMRIVVGPGLCVALNNERTVHAREPFTGQRVVLRTYVRTSLCHLRRLCPGSTNVFDARKLLLT